MSTKTTTVPDTAKAPQDRLPKAAVAEAKNTRPGPIEVSLYGETFTVAPDYFDDLDVIEALEDGHLVAVLRDLLAPEGYERLKAAIRAENDGRAPVSSLDKVFEALMGQVGPTARP